MSDVIIASQQKEICKKYNAEFMICDEGLMVGVGKSLNSGMMPLNGLRHNPEGQGTGWFIWAGGEIPSGEKFFEPVHAKHVKEDYPNIFKFLSLAPGWRFQIDDKGYEDVWFDEKLLED